MLWSIVRVGEVAQLPLLLAPVAERSCYYNPQVSPLFDWLHDPFKEGRAKAYKKKSIGFCNSHFSTLT